MPYHAVPPSHPAPTCSQQTRSYLLSLPDIQAKKLRCDWVVFNASPLARAGQGVGGSPEVARTKGEGQQVLLGPWFQHHREYSTHRLGKSVAAAWPGWAGRRSDARGKTRLCAGTIQWLEQQVPRADGLARFFPPGFPLLLLEVSDQAHKGGSPGSGRAPGQRTWLCGDSAPSCCMLGFRNQPPHPPRRHPPGKDLRGLPHTAQARGCEVCCGPLSRGPPGGAGGKAGVNSAWAPWPLTPALPAHPSPLEVAPSRLPDPAESHR